MSPKIQTSVVAWSAMLALGCLIIAGGILGAGAEVESPRPFHQLSCAEGERLVGHEGYVGLSAPRETAEEAALEYAVDEWPWARIDSADDLVLTLRSDVRVVFLSTDGRAEVTVARQPEGWRVEATLACESFVLQMSGGAG